MEGYSQYRWNFLQLLTEMEEGGFQGQTINAIPQRVVFTREKLGINTIHTEDPMPVWNAGWREHPTDEKGYVFYLPKESRSIRRSFLCFLSLYVGYNGDQAEKCGINITFNHWYVDDRTSTRTYLIRPEHWLKPSPIWSASKAVLDDLQWAHIYTTHVAKLQVGSNSGDFSWMEVLVSTKNAITKREQHPPPSPPADDIKIINRSELRTESTSRISMMALYPQFPESGVPESGALGV